MCAFYPAAKRGNINGYLVTTKKANVKLLSISVDVCGPGGTLSAHTIMVQPHLQGTSFPPGGFASTGSHHLISARLTSVSRDRP